MCGRYTIRASIETTAEAFCLLVEDLAPLEPTPRYNVAPSQSVLAMRWRPAGKQREPFRARWGLVPSWATDVSIGYKMINARSKTRDSFLVIVE